MSIELTADIAGDRLVITIEPWSGGPFHLTARLNCEVWLDRVPVKLDDFLRGEDSFLMAPEHTYHFYRELPITVTSPPGEVLFRLQLSWSDEEGGSGETLLQHWRLDPGRRHFYNVIGHAEVARFFGPVAVSPAPRSEPVGP